MTDRSRRNLSAARSTLLAVALAVGALPALAQDDSPARGAALDTKAAAPQEPPRPRYVGSRSCRECHERFYELWAPSHHGRAMQPFTAELAREGLTPQKDAIEVRGKAYRIRIEDGSAWMTEKGPEGEARYRIDHAMGGKNVYYFLTPLERGHLQVIPLGYDVRSKAWFDISESHMRHFVGQEDPLDWRDRLLTFNTSCYSCHVSQLETNYDLAGDRYATEWKEPGINCETCHGPSAEHVRVCREAPEGSVPEDLRIIRTKTMSVEQRNAMCAPCHAKMSPLTDSFLPGERYFDHFDLATLEDPDFYPDGRDRGENYTYTLWRMSPCARSGRLDCIHCHTSSGRYRFHGEGADGACLPCHEDRVRDVAAHSHHPAESEGSRCIACHMPMTEFARMRRSDHSMRPPAPAATIAHGSPNACNLCHADRDAAWADGWVRKWRERDYQAPMLRQGALVEAARKQEWTRLPEMLAYLGDPQRDEIVATSLVRLLRACRDDRTAPALRRALDDPSPLVRAAAADALADRLDRETVPELIEAAADEMRLVRVRAARALASIPPDWFAEQDREKVARATAEFEASLVVRPDDFASHYNLANLWMDRGDPARAIESFETSIRLRPDNLAALVNASLAYNAAGRNDRAEAVLRRALALDPDNAAANLNLGLLLGEMERKEEAREALRAAFEADPKSAVAAFNLGVLLAEEDPSQAIDWCRKASRLRPEEPRYAYTLAYYLLEAKNEGEAIRTLEGLVDRLPGYAEGHALLGRIHEEAGRKADAIAVYRRAESTEALDPRARAYFASRVAALEGR